MKARLSDARGAGGDPVTSVSVIVLNWNGRDFLTPCLESLQRQTFRDFETLVVDNASTDGSADLVRERYPWARLLVLDRNYGFCGGNNRGIGVTHSPYVVLLNNDTECAPDFLGALHDAIEAYPDAGMCASRMLNFADRSRIDSCGIGLLVSGNGYNRGSGKLNAAPFDRPGYVFGACAGAALYRRSMLDEIGLFDEDYIIYTDDTDLSWRGQLAGYRCRFVPEAVVYHMGSATMRRLSRDSLYRIQRNTVWTYLKNMPLALLIPLVPLHVLYSLYWLLRAVRQHQGRVVWEAKKDALCAGRSLWAKRRHIQSRRRATSEALLRRMDWRKV